MFVATVKPSKLSYSYILLVIWTSCYNTPVTGEHQVIGSTQDVLVKVGDDVTLPCRIEPSVSATNMTVEWSRPDLPKPNYVHVLQGGHVITHTALMNPSYKQRTFLFAEELSHGNISLKMFRVQLSDEGKFKCFVPKLRRSSEIQLLVWFVSQPVMSINGSSLTCDSGCWSPEPEISWLDSDGNLLPAEPSVTVNRSQHCYVVQRNVTVTQAGRVTCRVHLPLINHTDEIHDYIPESIFGTGGTDKTHLAGGLTAGIVITVIVLSVAAMLIFVWWKKQKQKQKSKEKLFMELEKLIPSATQDAGGVLTSLETDAETDAEKACFVTQHKLEILLRVDKVKEIVESLHSKTLIKDDDRASILKEKDSRSKMWALYTTVIGPGKENIKAEFYDALKDYEPNLLAMPVSQECVKMEDDNASGSCANPTPTERAYLLSCDDSPTKKYLLIELSESFHPSSTVPLSGSLCLSTGSVSFNVEGEASAPTINIPGNPGGSIPS